MLSRITLTGTLRHLTRLLTDHQRWHALADNAAYYRDHPEVANKSRPSPPSVPVCEAQAGI